MSRWRIGGFGAGAGRVRLRPAFLRPELLPFLIAVTLAGYWFGAPAMILLSLTAISVALMTNPARGGRRRGAAPSAQPRRPEAEAVLDQFLQDGAGRGLRTACLVAGPDDADALLQRLGHDDFEALIRRIGARLHGTLRDADRVIRLDRGHFAVLLSPTPHPDIENMIQLAVRLQAGCEVALPVAGQSPAVSIHLGICLSERAPARNGTAMLMAAEDAALEAEAHGPGAIRMFSALPPLGMQRQEDLAGELPAALETGEIPTCFQPQISMDTGAVSGLEAIPHWKHLRYGLLGPAEILAIAPAGDLIWTLTETVLHQALDAARSWDRAGLGSGLLSVGFPPAVLADPKLTDRLKWALEGADVEPARLCLVLQGEPAPHSDDGAILCNLTRCAEIGCVIEMSGFGAGPITLEMMRRAAVRRLRLPRSLVSRIDRETEQQKIVAAFAAMADGLHVETLAEGVANQSESAMLAQLGCRHLQGDAIAAPMPFAEMRGWIERHNAKLDATPRIPTRRGI